MNRNTLIVPALFFASFANAQTTSNSNNCDANFYVINQIEGSGIGTCESTASTGPAFLSYTRDHVANVSVGRADVALAYRLGGIKTSRRSQYSTFLFSEVEGSFGAADSTDQWRSGVYTEVFSKPGAVGARSDLFLIWGAGAFVLTDTDLDARGYGVSATLTPVINSDQLGLNYRGTEGAPYLIARADFEALKIDRGGSTGYADNSEHANLSGTIGFGYATKEDAVFPFDTAITLRKAYDFVDEDDFDTWSARFSVPVGRTDNVSLSLRYDKEEKPGAAQAVETTGVTLDFRF